MKTAETIEAQEERKRPEAMGIHRLLTRHL